MPLDYSVRRSTRRCAASDREFEAGESYVSALEEAEGEVVRRDYALQAWDGQNETVIAWWRSRMPAKNAKDQAAPPEVLLRLLDEWADRPEEAAPRYVLALLLIRRKVLRFSGGGLLDGLNEDEQSGGANETLRLVRPGGADEVEVPVTPPTAEEAPQVHARLTELLGAA